MPRKEGRAAREVAKRFERRELRRNDGKGSSVPRKKDEDAAAAAEWSAQGRSAIASQEEQAWKESRRLKWKESESGVSPLKMRPKECSNTWKTVKT